MKFENKYTTNEGEQFVYLDKDNKEVRIDKILISPDAFSLGDMIERLINKIEHLRTSK